MTRRIEFHEFARDEYIAAARWYEDCQPELRFGYATYFELSGDLMFVWAVAHGRRRPGYWWERLQERP